ncbi:hypothetical protein EMMF5_001379 [Cystobasidiomycetes sp. EMM_F5]
MGMPDADIHPTATGKAISTVNAHQDPQDLIFYSEEENPYHKDEQFLKVSPKGLVPHIRNTLRACGPMMHILPLKLGSLWIKSFIPAYFRCLQAQDADKQAEGLKDVVKALNHFGDGVKGPYWAGEDLTFADIILAPFAARLYILEQHRGLKDDLLNDGFKNWRKTILQRDSVVRTLSEEKYYEEIYGRYLRDEAQSDMAKGTRKGTGEP